MAEIEQPITTRPYSPKLLAILVIVLFVGVGVGVLLGIKGSGSTTSSTPTTAHSDLKTSANPQTVTNSDSATPTEPDQTDYSLLPNDLQAFIVASDQRIEPKCVANGQPIDPATGKVASILVRYDSRGFASLGLPTCDDSSQHLLVKVNGSWKDIAQTQLSFSCSLLQQYKVPALIEQSGDSATCLDADNSSVAYTQS
jgi:hypothetical protein